ncbi:phosphotransferase family protein [Actinomadura darangshiensis]|uniref:Phosphotransferase family protein n=1 Tax=Actinomadura darangshiensis TaxID=705336 RepID=A0A4R5BKZ7_9ACTN|nr:phosphotransferase family protein [Actinomadura darangshiensis]TDD86043.1 phosphotransferase family protein [Actinomadura darangshiensis]
MDPANEPVDGSALARWMDGRGLAPGEPVATSLISGGTSNEIIEVRRGGRTMVLRKPPRRVPPGRDETMLREFRVLTALKGTSVPHPEAIAACDDTGVIGSCFYLMEHVDGWSPMNVDGGWPEPFKSDLSLRPALAYQLVEGIARLGGVDWRARGLEGFGRPEGFHDRQVDRWLAHLAKFRFRDIPGIDEAAAWLRGHRPSHWEPGIIHGDYQFANVMFRHGAPARLAALVDFEMATVGDPLLDLAWVVMGWPDAGEDRGGQGYVDYTGMPDRADLLEHYARVSGRDVSEIDYYVILARFKMAIVLEGGYARHVGGEADNPKMAHYGDAVLRTAAAAAELAAATRL